MGRIDDLKTELDTDSLVRGYAGMDDAAAAADLNTVYRDGDTDIATLFNYMLMQETHSTDGDDTQDRSIWIRLKEVTGLVFATTGAQANPWGSTAIGTITEIQWIKCRQLYEYFVLALQGSLPLSLTDSNFAVYLAGAESAGCMSTAQETAIKALSENKRSRGVELGIGHIKAGHVQEARL